MLSRPVHLADLKDAFRVLEKRVLKRRQRNAPIKPTAPGERVRILTPSGSRRNAGHKNYHFRGRIV